ncbi:FtsB family cell division protein [Lysinibacillus piscis]|uniref:Cell division protein DIVIC n=1 Tax=Lysinibacillus piscis TaxID=2518931 RepID=A0ABQ5NPZ9_9BACI|nr:septum formation initiator family protein [Lysinibacillus sp. KH24]GLC90404.1 cell division protein DIVIC [Lysinibacillus sp. KH24]
MARRHSSNDEQPLTKLDNDYVRNTDKAINRKKEGRKRKIRRILFFAIVPVGIIIVLINILAYQSEALVIKEQKKEVADKQLAEVKEEHELLNLKIKQLEDDEYIAKLLRKEYYLSEEGEVIFIIPDAENKKDE